MTSTIPVREQHKIDYNALKKYLDTSVSFFAAGGPSEFVIKQFDHGQSNPTYLINYKGKRVVLRKKPHGKILRGSHAIDREWRIMEA
jgi:aminoglycoside phosphotransferase (APT) family kinase protein